MTDKSERAWGRRVPSGQNKIVVEDVAWHRNGIGGKGFHAVTFTETAGDAAGHRMVGVVFDAPGHVAVFDRDKLGAGEIEFGVNSFRGDFYESDLRAAIKARGGEGARS